MGLLVLLSSQVGQEWNAGMNGGSVPACMEKPEANYFHHWKTEENENNCKTYENLSIDISVFFGNTGQCIHKLAVGVEEQGLPTPPL